MKINATLQRATYPLAIFRQRNFSLLWCSMTSAGMGTQTENLVLGWFVLNLTDSPLLVGLVASARMALNFMAVLAGAVADRVPRQRLLATVEFSMALLGLGMLVLIFSGLLEVWHIFALTAGAGMFRLFQNPAAQSMVADTLTEDRIANGAALTNTGRNMTTVIGPLIGGILFQKFGPEGAFTFIAALYFLSGIFALSIGNISRTRRREGESILRSIVEGVKYAKGQQVLWAILILAVIINFTGWPLHTSLMPIFARDVLGTGSTGLGMLMSAFGVGALLGSMVWASSRNIKSPGKLLILAVIFWHLSMVAFSASSSFYLSLAILLVTGASFSSSQVLILTLVLKTTLPEFRGRILGLRSLSIYSFTFGSMNSGAIAGTWGAPWAANINAAIGIVLVGILALFTPKLRRA
ncbi:MAG: hypothetical protein BZY88_11890 [SAR202 cluster bacterium Io17-Chloro-G9]|nr:MAG: hypothetical protein BZY88_11890 [SAR202 cluster bacterium Io17-Chloro-G9]